MINSKFLRNDRGFTLLEVLLSLTILGIVLTSTMSFFSQAYSYTKLNENKTVGINVARNILYYIEQQDLKEAQNALTRAKLSENGRLEAEVNCTSTDIIDINEKKVCEDIFNPEINNQKYEVQVALYQHEELFDYLVPVEVTVTWGKDNKAVVEGVIKE